jgi:ribosomal-protein-alanine N-acetyltransferase
MNQFPVLKTKRLVLREFQTSDAEAVFDIFSRDRVTRYVDTATMHSVEEAAKKIRDRIDLFRNEQGLRWGITLQGQEDIVIGSCGLYLLNRAWFSCEIGYELHPQYWRGGIMTEALTAIINFAYSGRFFFPLNRIQALTYLDNEASAGLLKGLGFQEEGVWRAYGYWKNQFHDLRCFSLLRREWAT